MNIVSQQQLENQINKRTAKCDAEIAQYRSQLASTMKTKIPARIGANILAIIILYLVSQVGVQISPFLIFIELPVIIGGANILTSLYYEHREKETAEQIKACEESKARDIAQMTKDYNAYYQAAQIAEKEQKEKQHEEEKEIERQQIEKAEQEAYLMMSESTLVGDIAKCIMPFFKSIIDHADRTTHLKVRVRLALSVSRDSIEYYDLTNVHNIQHFIFSEEGIDEELTPVMRKALCKVLTTELISLVYEEYTVDPNGQRVQVNLEESVSLEGHTYGVNFPESDDSSIAKATILYQTFIDKVEKHF